MFDCWIFTACAGSGGEVWTGRTVGGFVAIMTGFGVAACWRWSSARIYTGNGRSAIQSAHVHVSRKRLDIPGNRRINDRLATVADQLIIASL